MKKLVVLIVVMDILLAGSAYAMQLTADNDVTVEPGEYTVHTIYRSESYWTDRKYDKEVVTELKVDEDKTLYFKEDIKEDGKKYNYMCVLVGDSGNIYVYYNNYDK